MKVLAINGSPHKSSSTMRAIEHVSSELLREGIDVETVHIGTAPLQGCTACGGCAKSGEGLCVLSDDIVNECIKKMSVSDGLIIASPVYFAGIAGSMKCFLDRFFFAGKKSVEYKAAASICALRRAGSVNTFNQLNNYLGLANVVITPSHYWNAAFGTNPDEIDQDLEGSQLMRYIGRNMAWIMTVLEKTKSELPHPVMSEKRERFNFIR